MYVSLKRADGEWVFVRAAIIGSNHAVAIGLADRRPGAVPIDSQASEYIFPI